MSLAIRKFIDADISVVTEIWNEIIDEGKSFPWDKHLDRVC